MNKKLHFLIVPFALVILSFLLEPECTQGLCLFSGKGIPLGYYYKGIFHLDVFVVDYIFFFIVYSIPILLVEDIKRKVKK